MNRSKAAFLLLAVSILAVIWFTWNDLGGYRVFQCSTVKDQSSLLLESFATNSSTSRAAAAVAAAANTRWRPLCSKHAILCNGLRRSIPAPSTFHLDLKTLSLDSLKFLFHGIVSSIEFTCPSKKGFGASGLGAYEICMTPDVQPQPGSCLVYSFGISTDWSFDEQMASFGCEVHSFDPSIGKVDHVHAPNVTFHNLGLWGSDITNSNGWKLERLSTIRKRLGHDKREIDILKVDVEGGEWPFLRDVLYYDQRQLKTVKQMAIEIHSPRYKFETVTKADLVEMILYVTELRRAGFESFKNFHDGNCCGAFASLMPPEIPERCCEEMALVNRQYLH